ncbi:hypothetical protein [Burkholderia vietnamiensis]|uniref:hypothetical protein n=1 Tax=Burkholderia vietnamiensis TaxID=60552 RepID=UPI000A58ABA9|nr:hypothetical protein [Burkholderia vietnamiensis]MDN8038537.1 hypothetical protein [Burkholderia vietnamiensis]HDR9046246.1 hypothetical protein [Burkholderia vietnamiensis]HDR9230470.1 hypothetical protein [Burkholderia vietnamiensis]
MAGAAPGEPSFQSGTSAGYDVVGAGLKTKLPQSNRGLTVDFLLLTDADLTEMRQTPKRIVNPSARWVSKGSHRQKDFNVIAERDPEEKYRVFLRISEHNESVFSAGIMRIFSSGETLVLARYNGGYHPHRNVIERTKVPAVCHKHTATERYIQAGHDPDGFAEPITGYNTVDGAFEMLQRECGFDQAPPMIPPAPTPIQPDLFD